MPDPVSARPSAYRSIPDARGDAQAGPSSAPQRPTSSPPGLSRQELGLAGYLTARAADRRPVDSKDVDRLRVANQTINETRQRLPHGRANVEPDLKATQNENLYRNRASRQYCKVLNEELNTGQDDWQTRTAHRAASATAYGTGNCGEYAAVAWATHLHRLAPDERLAQANTQGVDHRWCEVIDLKRDQAVVIDAWSEGPPVLAEDGAFASMRGKRHFVPVGTQAIAESVESTLRELESRTDEKLGPEKRRELLENVSRHRPTGEIYAPTSVFASDFKERVRPKLAKDSLQAEIVAAGAARALGQPVAALKNDVPGILDVTQHLMRD